MEFDITCSSVSIQELKKILAENSYDGRNTGIVMSEDTFTELKKQNAGEVYIKGSKDFNTLSVVDGKRKFLNYHLVLNNKLLFGKVRLVKDL